MPAMQPNSSESAHYRSYILRIWRTSDRAQPWYQLQHVVDKTVVRFGSAAELLSFLTQLDAVAPQVATPPADSPTNA